VSRSAIILLLAAFSPSCAETPTELVVVVDSDLSVPDELGAVRALVGDTAGSPASLNDFVFSDQDRVLPFSFVVVPAGEDLDKVIVIELVAFSAARDVLFERRAETQFQSERRLKLPMFLSEECVNVAPTCEASMTCTETGCAAAARASSELEEIEPGEEL
jgi:hypothetical protein